MKILIIGSMGFIGSHACRFFSLKNEVWGADVISDDNSEKYILLNKNDTSYENIFINHQFDLCINASGNGSVPISLNQPIFDFDLNVTNTIKLLDAIRRYSPSCKLINLSSAAVYGNPTVLPISETAALRPMSPYGWHKMYSEQICKEYYNLYNLRTINLRLFSVYGEGLKKQIFWDTYQKYVYSNEIDLFGSGNETRDFIYILDLMNAIQCVVNHGIFNGEAINVASGIETTINDAVSIFCAEISKNIKVRFNQIVKPGDPLNWRADISILSNLGFAPQITLAKGLKNIVEWLAALDK